MKKTVSNSSGMVALVAAFKDRVHEVAIVPEAQVEEKLTQMRIQYLEIEQSRLDEWRADYVDSGEDVPPDARIVDSMYGAHIEDYGRWVIDRANKLTISERLS